MQGLYFVGYALIATIAGIVVAWAQYTRKKAEGIPINYDILKIVFAVALAMWAGAAFAYVAYTHTTTAAALAGFAIGVVLSVIFAWQIAVVINNIESDKQALRELATRDALTGLWNRRIFHETLATEVARANRFKHPLSLLLFDIDDFEALNTTHGHKAGDMVLRALGERLTNMVRAIDTACRYGGEEFALILPDTDSVSAEGLARRIQREFSQESFDAGVGDKLAVTVSIGIASHGNTLRTDQSLLDAAVDMLMTAQDGDPGTVVVCAPEAPPA